MARLRLYNPLTRWLEWKSAEREADRQLIRDGLNALQTAFQAQSIASQAQAKVFQDFLASFQIGGQPSLREWDEAENTAKYFERTGRVYPDELKGLSMIDQFELLLDKIDT